jgi:transitional endoplasmic reticulum ATPase
MVEVLLKKAQEYINKAVEAESRSDSWKARKNYLNAAKLLFDAARESHGQMKVQRVENAEKLVAKADSMEVDIQSDTKRSRKTHTAERQKANDGEDDSRSLILSQRPDTSFDDVAGLEHVKEEIRLKLIYPFEHRNQAKKYGQKSGGGILLYGPPGTGKTMLGRAVAGEVEADFFSVKPSDLMDQYVGNTEKKIANMFKTARECERAVIFIDEIESLMPKRKGQRSTVMSRVVPQFLAELDGVDTSNENILFLGATNEPWSLDGAALRPGRFDEKVYIPPPDLEARRKIFELNIEGKPLSYDIDLDELAGLTENYSGADISYICKKAAAIPFKEAIETGEERDICMEDMKQAMDNVGPSLDEKVIEGFENYFKDHSVRPKSQKKDADVSANKKPAPEIKSEEYKKPRQDKPASRTPKKAKMTPHLNDPSDIRNLIIQEPSSTFDDVAGMDGVKQDIKNILDEALKYPEIYKQHFGKLPAGAAILLYGVPGCGKTFIGKAAAGEFRDSATFIYVKPSDIKISKYTHIKLQRIKDIFNLAKKNAPSIVLWDEIEGLVWARDKPGVPTWSRELVPEFLTLFQGAEESDDVVLHIGTSNFPWVIDMAMLRSGRFSKRIFISSPDYEARLTLFELETRDANLADDVDLNVLAEMTDGVTGADITEIVKQAMEIPWNEWTQERDEGGPRETGMSDLLQVVEGFVSSSLENYLKVARQQLMKFDDATPYFPELVEEINESV